jgi:amino acid transporter
VAAIFCQFNLKHVLQAILSIRAIIPFMAQIAGAVILRQARPDLRRPFRMWLYPLPAIIAFGLWIYVIVSPEKRLQVGGIAVIAAGTLFYFLRQWLQAAATAALRRLECHHAPDSAFPFVALPAFAQQPYDRLASDA